VVRDADHRTLGDVGMVRQYLLDRPCGEAMPGNVDDVVDPAHHEEVTVLVEVPSVTGHVVAGERGHVRLYEAVVCPPEGCQRAGWKREADRDCSFLVGLAGVAALAQDAD